MQFDLLYPLHVMSLMTPVLVRFIFQKRKRDSKSSLSARSVPRGLLVRLHLSHSLQDCWPNVCFYERPAEAIFFFVSLSAAENIVDSVWGGGNMN